MNETETFRLAKNGNKEAKEKIVSDNTGLVWSVARRFFGRGYEPEDIYQIGCIGLLKAIERFSEEYEVKFSTYAVPLIVGEIKRFLRDNGMIKVSRILKQNGYRISRAKEELSVKLGRDPSLEEISAATGLTDEEIVLATDANREVESIYQPVYEHDGNEICLMDRLTDESKSYAAEEGLYNKIIIEQAMSLLGKNEQKLISLRYFQDKTQNETAKELGMSQVQVSRLEKKLLFNMRNTIDNKSNL